MSKSRRIASALIGLLLLSPLDFLPGNRKDEPYYRAACDKCRDHHRTTSPRHTGGAIGSLNAGTRGIH